MVLAWSCAMRKKGKAEKGKKMVHEGQEEHEAGL
jgi:hypothetical protein